MRLASAGTIEIGDYEIGYAQAYVVAQLHDLDQS
jgi:hypothetical protein